MIDQNHIVFITDVHLGLRFPYTTHVTKDKVAKMQHEALKALHMLPGKKAILGDLFHSFMPTAATLCQAINVLNDAYERGTGRETVTVLAGNHDESKIRTDASGLDLLADLMSGSIGFVIDQHRVMVMDNVELYLIPHQLTQELFDAAIKVAAESTPKAVIRILCLHCNQGDFPGNQAENYLSTEQLKTLSGFDKVVSGHEHSAKTVMNMEYPGSVVPCSFAEFDQRYVLSVHAITGEFHRTKYEDIPGFPDYSYARMDVNDFVAAAPDAIGAKFVEVTGIVSPAESVALTSAITKRLSDGTQLAIKPAVTIQNSELVGDAPAALANVENWWSVVQSRLNPEGNAYFNTYFE